MNLRKHLNKWMRWPVVLILAAFWLKQTWDGYDAMQVDEYGIDTAVLERYYDRSLRAMDAAERAGPYARWIVGYEEKESTLRTSLDAIINQHAYVEALENEGGNLAELLSLKLGMRDSIADRFEDTEYRARYREWLLAGQGQAWHYERFIHVTKDAEVERFYEEQNDRLLRRIVATSLIYDILTAMGLVFAYSLLVRRRPAMPESHPAMQRWSANAVLGGFFAINLLLGFGMKHATRLYDLLVVFLPELLAYTLYDFSWRAFDAFLLLFLFLKTPKNVCRVFRFKSPIHVPLLLAVFSATALIEMGMYYLTPNAEVDPMDFMESAHTDTATMLSVLFSSVLVAPIFEEIVFRGFLLQGIRKKLGNTPAILISTALFMLVHVQYDIWGGLSVAGMGLGAAFLTIRTGSLNTSIAYHALINLWITMHTYYQYQHPL